MYIIGIVQSIRRGSLDTHSTDLDDIHEHQTHGVDHQYFTFNGQQSGGAEHKRSIYSDAQRNTIFHTGGLASSLDDQPLLAGARPRQRFDNTSFSRDLAETVVGGAQRERPSKTSLQGMLKNFGKKAHLWPRKRHETTSTCNMSLVTSPVNDPQEQFRSRSKSLDVSYITTGNPILNDCDATYKIFDKIVREGKRRSSPATPANALVGVVSAGAAVV